MRENQKSEDSLIDEFRNLGKNLADTAKAAWDNPERQRLQNEIEDGLSEMRLILKNEYEHFRESPTGQRLKKDMEDLSERIQSSEIEGKIRKDLIKALHQVNAELENTASRWAESSEMHSQTDTQENPGEEDTQND